MRKPTPNCCIDQSHHQEGKRVNVRRKHFESKNNFASASFVNTYSKISESTDKVTTIATQGSIKVYKISVSK